MVLIFLTIIGASKLALSSTAVFVFFLLHIFLPVIVELVKHSEQ